MSNWNPNNPPGSVPPSTGWPSNSDDRPANAPAPQQGMQPYGAPGYPQPSYPPQGYPQPSYPPQGYPQPSYPPQGYPQPGYPPQGYPQPMMQPMIINVMGGAASSSSSSSAAIMAPMVVKPKTSHVLHLLLTIFTGGLWLPVWITLYMIRGCN